jgi:hypothetical protein
MRATIKQCGHRNQNPRQPGEVGNPSRLTVCSCTEKLWRREWDYSALRASPLRGRPSGVIPLRFVHPINHHQAPRISIAIFWRREWDSNPRTPVKMLLEFQSSAFDRSAISPFKHLRELPRNHPALPRSRKGANDTPSGLRRRLLWHIERRWLVEAAIAPFSGRRRRRIQRRDVQGIRGVRRIQPRRNLQGGNAGRPHVRLGVVARAAHVSQVLATRETRQRSHNSDQHEAIPHLFLAFHE